MKSKTDLRNVYRKVMPNALRLFLYRSRTQALPVLFRSLIRITDPSIMLMRSRMEKLRGAYAGQRCFIMGNGPSLNQMRLDLFRDEIVWGSNRCYLLFERISWRPKFYVAVDKRVVPDNSKEINELVNYLPSTLFFFPEVFRYNHVIHSKENLFWFSEKKYLEGRSAFDNFSLNPALSMSAVRTVTISALQLAVFLGFDPIYLIGCDTSYTIPKNTLTENGNNEYLISPDNDDQNHFSVEYFGTGKKWHDPHVDRMIKHYQESLEVCKSNGIRIFNATVGGQLEVFPRVNYLDLF